MSGRVHTVEWLNARIDTLETELRKVEAERDRAFSVCQRNLDAEREFLAKIGERDAMKAVTVERIQSRIGIPAGGEKP
jgi:uncharacterized small protein (DUF1192 family)